MAPTGRADGCDARAAQRALGRGTRRGGLRRAARARLGGPRVPLPPHAGHRATTHALRLPRVQERRGLLEGAGRPQGALEPLGGLQRAVHARDLPLPSRLARDQPDRARELLDHNRHRPVEGVARALPAATDRRQHGRGAGERGGGHRDLRCHRDAHARRGRRAHGGGLGAVRSGELPAPRLVLVGGELARRRGLPLRFRDDDAAALHQLQAAQRRAPALARAHVQGVQHLHRRRLRAHGVHAHRAPRRLPARRRDLPRLPLSALVLPRRQDACQRVRHRLRA
mmetsp:Transcript_16438/g.40724  ORF Transcript_16438/g.40724 Transcript_16438/m.40724 type:complete len:283 (+) Transcript_16438:250-1098(+)